MAKDYSRSGKILGLALQSVRRVSDPFYMNSAFIGITKIINAASGFIFWSIAARYYSIGDVGTATALISSLGIIMTLSRFGFDNSMIRFMPIRDKSEVFSTCLWMAVLLSILGGSLYIALANFITPSISFSHGYGAIFIIFAIMNSVALTTGMAFLSQREGKQYFIQNILLALRIPLLVPLAAFGGNGIFFSLGAAYILASIVAILQISRSLKTRLTISTDFIAETFRFSYMNYISNVFGAIPLLVLPIMVLNLLGPEEAAKYYIALAIGNLIMIIPDAMSTSLFVEGSHGIDLRKSTIRTLLSIYALLIPAAIAVYIEGGLLLGIFGREYMGALDLLRIFVVSSFFVTVHNVFIPVQNILLRSEVTALVNFIKFVILMGTSYILILRFGIEGTGFAWMITYMVISLLILVISRKSINSICFSSHSPDRDTVT